MKRFLAASAILGVATIVLAAWTPVSQLPPATFTAVRFYPAPPAGAGFGEMEQMEKRVPSLRRWLGRRAIRKRTGAGSPREGRGTDSRGCTIPTRPGPAT